MDGNHTRGSRLGDRNYVHTRTHQRFGSSHHTHTPSQWATQAFALNLTTTLATHLSNALAMLKSQSLQSHPCQRKCDKNKPASHPPKAPPIFLNPSNTVHDLPSRRDSTDTADDASGDMGTSQDTFASLFSHLSNDSDSTSAKLSHPPDSMDTDDHDAPPSPSHSHSPSAHSSVR